MIDFKIFIRVWEEIVRKREEEAKTDLITYWTERAHDYADSVLKSNFSLGYKFCEVLSRLGIIDGIKSAIDIGAGPGTISIPLAKHGIEVIAVEPVQTMIQYLEYFSKQNEVHDNIIIIRSKFPEICNILRKTYDIVICSHVIWMFPDIGKVIKNIMKLSHKWCCIIGTVKTSYTYHDICRELDLDRVMRTFPDYIITYNALYALDIQANVIIVEYEWAKSPEMAVIIIWSVRNITT